MINWKTNAEKPEEPDSGIFIVQTLKCGRPLISTHDQIKEVWQNIDRWCYLSELVADAMAERPTNLFSARMILDVLDRDEIDPHSIPAFVDFETRIRFINRVKSFLQLVEIKGTKTEPMPDRMSRDSRIFRHLDEIIAGSPITNTWPQDL